MTNAELIATIRNEIERLKDEYTDIAIDSHYGTVNANHVVDDLEQLLSLLSTLESEKPINLDELMKEAQRYYFDNFEYLSSDQPTLSILTNIARHFAKWGAEQAREQIMKETVEGTVEDIGVNYIDLIDFDAEKLGLIEGDKVRIIIVKED